MKKIQFILAAVFFLCAASGISQIATNLVVSATPPSILSLWPVQKQTIIFIVSGDVFETEYKIKTEIQLSDGTVIGKTDLTKSRNYTLTGTTVFNADDVVPLENMIFAGQYKNALNRSGKLPAGNYQICVQLVNAVEFTPFSEVNCKPFFLMPQQLPILVQPSKEEVLDVIKSQTEITFRWTPLSPVTQSVPNYKIFVFEVNEGQTPMQALRTNMPILEEEVHGVTQYIWQPRGILYSNPVDGNGMLQQKQLVWTIQTLDGQSQPAPEGSISGDGVSEPVCFFIANKK